jgi:hypothetical protein
MTFICPTMYSRCKCWPGFICNRGHQLVIFVQNLPDVFHPGVDVVEMPVLDFHARRDFLASNAVGRHIALIGCVVDLRLAMKEQRRIGRP